jgi:hypothetical protein
MCYSKSAILALFLEVFVTNCMETLLEAEEGKYIYTYEGRSWWIIVTSEKSILG